MSSLIAACGRGSLPRLRTHRNPGLEIVYISRGHLLWHVQGRVEPVPAESVYFSLPHQEHGSAEEFEPGHEWTFIILAPDPWKRSSLLHPSLHFSKQESTEIQSILAKAKRHAFRATDGIKWILPEIVAEISHPGLHHEAKVAGLTRACVVELMRSIRAGQRAGPPDVRSGVQNRVRALVSRMAEHPDEPWTLSRMAAQCRLGRTQFTKILHEQTGDTPVKLINRLRVRLACRQLRETDLPITGIALACGFSTSQYFAKVFKTYTGGMDARSYRKQHRDH